MQRCFLCFWCFAASFLHFVEIENHYNCVEFMTNNHTSFLICFLLCADDLNISLELREAESNHLRRSPFSSLSDDSDESEQALLQECILAGMPKSNSSPVPAIPDPSEIPNDPNLLQNEIIESEPSDDEDDANILENCINIGMTSNR
jgi:hypothetical protein